MFSVVIPVYNVEKHLDKCLKSVVNQTFKDIEIIVVNDGSTDGSAEIINKYRTTDSRIKLITQKNGGLSAARNSGLRVATKKYVMFIDSDDFIEENTCERLAEYVEKNKSDVYIFGLYYNFHNKLSIGGQKLQYGKFDDGKKYMKIALEEGSFRTFAHSKLFSNNLLGAETSAHSEKIRFVPDLLYEDMFFVVQVLCKAKSVTVVPEFFYHYVQHQSGRITAQYNERDLDVLTFVDMLNSDYFCAGEINKFIYAVLTFRWVSSCLIYKYIPRHFFNKQAKKMIDTAVKNESFRKAAQLCATEKGVSRRDRYLAVLLNRTPFFYKIVTCVLLTARGFVRNVGQLLS
jgi:glycosyltransferase involved in cell wall biosynthesis